jgi:hypothetical protein
MKKVSLQVLLLLAFIAAFAQDNESHAEKVGYNIGQILGYMLIPAILIGGIAYLVRRQKKS